MLHVSWFSIKTNKRFCKFSVIFCFEEKKDRCLISIIISVPSSLIPLNLCFSDVFPPDDQNDNDRHQQYRHQNTNHDSGNLTSTEDLCKAMTVIKIRKNTVVI